MDSERGGSPPELQPLHGSGQTCTVYACALFSPVAYFRRYGEHLAECGKTVAAWEATEAEFRENYPGFERFRNYNAFREAHRRHRNGVPESFFKIHIVWK